MNITRKYSHKAAIAPPHYLPEMGNHLCEEIAAGADPAELCAQPGYPALTVVFVWLQQAPEFARAWQEANKARAAVLVQQALAIADDSSEDYQYKVMKDGRQELVYNHEHPARAKLRVQTRQWMAQRLDRDAWGDKRQVDIDQRVLTINMTDEEIDKRIAAAQAKLIELEPERNET